MSDSILSIIGQGHPNLKGTWKERLGHASTIVTLSLVSRVFRVYNVEYSLELRGVVTFSYSNLENLFSHQVINFSFVLCCLCYVFESWYPWVQLYSIRVIRRVPQKRDETMHRSLDEKTFYTRLVSSSCIDTFFWRLGETFETCFLSPPLKLGEKVKI